MFIQKMPLAKPRSNSQKAGLIVPGTLIWETFSVQSSMLKTDDVSFILLAAMVICWATGLAIYIAGYWWKNLAPHSRGPHKVEEPRQLKHTSKLEASLGHFGSLGTFQFIINDHV